MVDWFGELVWALSVGLCVDLGFAPVGVADRGCLFAAEVVPVLVVAAVGSMARLRSWAKAGVGCGNGVPVAAGDGRNSPWLCNIERPCGGSWLRLPARR